MDELAKLVLKDDQDKINEFESITKQGMNGEIDFTDSLSRRVEMLSATKDDISVLIEYLRSKLSPSISYLIKIVDSNQASSYIVSGGFLDYLRPICVELGFLPQNIFANQFVFQIEKIIGFDTDNFLSNPNGKSKLISTIHAEGKKIMIGDGYTDFKVKLDCQADVFIAYTESIYRKNIIQKADYICKDFKELIQILNTIDEK